MAKHLHVDVCKRPWWQNALKLKVKAVNNSRIFIEKYKEINMGGSYCYIGVLLHKDLKHNKVKMSPLHTDLIIDRFS